MLVKMGNPFTFILPNAQLASDNREYRVMGSYDDNSGNSPIPGGSLAKPVLIALGALLIGKMLKGHGDDTAAAPAQPVPVPDQSQAGGGRPGGILGRSEE